MATTSIWPVKSNLGRVVRYAQNPEKTAGGDPMEAVLGYATGITKTEQMMYVTGVNCDLATAREEMVLTKEAWNRMEPGRALAFHGYQSFAPGETTPRQAHEIGVEFARRMWGGRFQVVVATHLDRGHLHNHFVLNSISFVDGGRYHDNKASYYGQIRKISDTLCKEYGLSVVEHPKGRGKHYTEWKAEKEGVPTIRGQLREELDAIIAKSFTFGTFVEELQRRGYAVKFGPNVTHMAVKPKGAQRFVRLKSLGANYTEEVIRQRIAGQRSGTVKPFRRKYPNRGYKPSRPHKKLKGFIALYYRYLYMLGKVKKGKPPKKAVFFLRKEVTKLERYDRQFRYLYENKLEDASTVESRQQALEQEIRVLTERRQPLYAQRKEAENENTRAALSEEIAAFTAKLRKLRKEKRLCAAILATAGHVAEVVEQAERLESEPEKDTKQKQPERFRLR
ncbi:relaxase/mobilization nuclease domain-containing protein [Ruminococcaceae bacterium OttesenSCG-928-A16]|nr:relaxase/mobilization nuclease domain-containing protein [Ruminococcaceae bacterium OttesenSCG-928-A16]